MAAYKVDHKDHASQQLLLEKQSKEGVHIYL